MQKGRDQQCTTNSETGLGREQGGLSAPQGPSHTHREAYTGCTPLLHTSGRHIQGVHHCYTPQGGYPGLYTTVIPSGRLPWAIPPCIHLREATLAIPPCIYTSGRLPWAIPLYMPPWASHTCHIPDIIDRFDKDNQSLLTVLTRMSRLGGSERRSRDRLLFPFHCWPGVPAS